MFIRILTPLVLFTLAVIPAHASEADLDNYKKELISLNQDIGTYYFIDDSLSKDIEDNHQQKVGTVQDFLINEKGQVETLVAELNALKLSDEPLQLSYQNITQNNDGFVLASAAENMEEQLAEYLANIETAAGEESKPLVSTKRLHGREILLPITGESIGEVERVITNKETNEVVGVLIKGLKNRPEYERFALPYPNGLRIKNTGLNNDLELEETYAETVQKFTAEGIPH